MAGIGERTGRTRSHYMVESEKMLQKKIKRKQQEGKPSLSDFTHVLAEKNFILIG